jgi:hypothetical protein
MESPLHLIAMQAEIQGSSSAESFAELQQLV